MSTRYSDRTRQLLEQNQFLKACAKAAMSRVRPETYLTADDEVNWCSRACYEKWLRMKGQSVQFVGEEGLPVVEERSREVMQGVSGRCATCKESLEPTGSDYWYYEVLNRRGPS